MATLSLVFAFVFAPVGAVLGHLALSQIKQRNQPGRPVAILGVTLSYVLIVLGVVGLVAWSVNGPSKDNGVASSATSTTRATHRSATTTRKSTKRSTTRSTPRSTPSETRQPLQSPADLKVGDCIEMEKLDSDPDDPGTTEVKVYLVQCEARDGVYQVQQILKYDETCPSGKSIGSPDADFRACYTDYR